MTMPATLPPTSRLREVLAPFAEYAARNAERAPSGEPCPAVIRVTPFDMEGAAMRSWPVGDGQCEQRSNGDIEQIAPMLAAVKAFRARYDGELVDIDLNTRVAVGHAIARSHPECFAPLIGVGINARIDPTHAAATTRARSATSTASRIDSEPLYIPKSTRPQVKRWLHAPDDIPVVLRDTPGPVAVSVSESAYNVIKQECLRFADRRGVETGGYLAGNVLRSWDRSVNVCDATGPGPETEHGIGTISLDRSAAQAIPGNHAWTGEDIDELGWWHTHPEGAATPSPVDLASWSRALERIGARRGSGLYLGVIVTPSRSGSWHNPQLHAHVARRGERRGVVCESAAISVRQYVSGAW
jgi:proteasome lid subunit RPN8/RPN11